MTHSEPPREEHNSATLHQPRALRLVLLTMITICGVLMISIALSDPRVASVLNLSAEYVSHDDVTTSEHPGEATSVFSLGLETDETSAPQPTATNKSARSAVGLMPVDRLPVRRGGITGSN